MNTPTVEPETAIAQLSDRDPAERVTWLREQTDPSSTLLALIEHASKLAISEAPRAVEQLDMLIALSDALDDPTARCRSRRAAVRALSYNGRYKRAIEVAHEAMVIARDAGLSEEQGRAQLAEMHPLVEMGRIADALAAGESARSVFVLARLPSMAARADINLGVVSHKNDVPRRAIEYFDRAREVLRDEPLTIGHLENNRGEALLAINDFTGAEAAFTAALEAFEDADVHLTAAIAAGNLADLAVRQGRLGRAMQYFERARRSLEQAGSPTHLARVMAEQAEAQTLLGLGDVALRQFESALTELDRSGCRIEAARARRGMGVAMLQAGRLAEAETLLAAAASGYQQLGHESAGAQVDSIRAQILEHHGNHREARQLALRCLAALDDRPADAVMVRHLLASIAARLDSPDEALAQLDAAILTARRYEIAPILATLLGSRAQLNVNRGNYGIAKDDLRDALAAVDRVRGSLQAERFRMAFFGKWTSFYELLIDLLIDERSPTSNREAFNVAEQSRSRALLDRLGRGALDDQTFMTATNDDTAASLHADLIAQRSELNVLYSRLADGQLNLLDDDTLADWRVSIRQRESRIDELEDRLCSTESAGLYARPCTIDQVQQSLAPDHALVEYLRVRDTLIAFVVTRESLEVVRCPAGTDDILPMLEQLGFQMNRALRVGANDSPRMPGMVQSAQRSLQRLHGALLAPIEQFLTGVSRVTFVPWGALHAVPFHALYDGYRYLIERAEVLTAPSASICVTCMDQPDRSSHTPTALLVGMDDERAPHMLEEVQRLKAQLDGYEIAVLESESATTDAVLRTLQSASIAHIATHGVFMAETPNAAGLKLADRWLTALDLASARISAELVVLSGCETGMSAIRAGDEIVGLPGALMSAGATSVLVSLWRVEDKSSMQLMERIFAGLSREQSLRDHKAAAVRKAQLSLLREAPHPAFWAPFILAGGA